MHAVLWVMDRQVQSAKFLCDYYVPMSNLLPRRDRPCPVFLTVLFLFVLPRLKEMHNLQYKWLRRELIAGCRSGSMDTCEYEIGCNHNPSLQPHLPRLFVLLEVGLQTRIQPSCQANKQGDKHFSSIMELV
jgi:hypothetical protein